MLLYLKLEQGATMHTQQYLERQKQRIEERMARCEKVVKDPNRLDKALKAGKVLPSQRKALALIENGGYGICAGCVKPIPVERLRHVPAALRCVPCQSDTEK